MKHFARLMAMAVMLALFCTGTVFAADMFMPDRSWDGFYLLEQTDVYNGGPDIPPPPGFEKRFDGVAFEIRRGMVYFSNGCASYGEPKNVELAEYFRKFLYSEDVNALKIRFKHKFDVDLPDNPVVWELPWCEGLYADMLFLPNKVFLIDEGLFYGAYKKVGAKEYLKVTGLEKCPEGNAYTIEMGGVMQYVFYDWTLEQVYADMLLRYSDEAKHLRRQLPVVNAEYVSNVDNEGVQINYYYASIKELVIEMWYGGGVTTFEIAEADGVCLAYVTHSEG